MEETSFYYKILHIGILPLLLRKLIVIASSWTFQSILHMDSTERNFKILLDVLLGAALFYVLFATQNVGLEVAFISSAIISHTVNYLTNGHFYVALKNIGHSNVEQKRFASYIERIGSRASRKQSISSAAIFGRLSRGSLTSSSDLDIRMIRRNGFLNGVKACLFVVTERTRALLNRFPLDIYVVDNCEWLKKKVRKDELPVILVDKDNTIRQCYEQTVDYATLKIQ